MANLTPLNRKRLKILRSRLVHIITLLNVCSFYVLCNMLLVIWRVHQPTASKSGVKKEKKERTKTSEVGSQNANGVDDHDKSTAVASKNEIGTTSAEPAADESEFCVSELRSRAGIWIFYLFTALLLGICLIYTALLTSHHDAVSGRRPPLNWSSLCRGL